MNDKDNFLPTSILASALILSGTWIYTTGVKTPSNLGEVVTPLAGVELPVSWGDLGKRMVEAGVINKGEFAGLYIQRGGLSQDMKALLDLSDNKRIKMTSENSGILLNLLWALGLGNKNPILTSGPMQDPQYGGAGGFASTGGWTLAQGKAMDHYGMHEFVTLTPDEQALVESVAKNIYRPCCGNSVYFPDCNHGMAMLGLLELMASQGVKEAEMYKTALVVNSYWFPDTYLTIAKYLRGKGIDWNAVKPKEILGATYSSATGYRQIVAAMAAEVDTGTSGNLPKSSGGCGV